MGSGAAVVSKWLWIAALVAAALAGAILFALQHRGSGPEPLVVYCAHDAVFAQKVLDAFQKETGIALSVRYDTEATKSLSLMELLLREQQTRRCDVFWNNQWVGMGRLKAAGLLEPYAGPGHQRIPSRYHDPEGHWTGFAARLRVFIVNQKNIAATDPASLAAAVDQRLDANLNRVAIAKPLYGTTLTQYSAQWALAGPESLKGWHGDWRKRGVREVAGNAAVKNLVAQGVCDLGLTDTDDFFDARDAGAPVTMLPIRITPQGGVAAGQPAGHAAAQHATGPATQPATRPAADARPTICIPNTVAIVRGTRRLGDAQKLVDFLASERGELALAASGSRQIPLGAVDEAKLSDDVRELRRFAAEGLDLHALGDAPDRCLDWLKAEYLH